MADTGVDHEMHQAEGEITSSAGRTTVGGGAAAVLPPAGGQPAPHAGRDLRDVVKDFSRFTAGQVDDVRSSVADMRTDVDGLRVVMDTQGERIDAMVDKQNEILHAMKQMQGGINAMQRQDKAELAQAVRESLEDPEKQRERSRAAVERVEREATSRSMSLSDAHPDDLAAAAAAVDAAARKEQRRRQRQEKADARERKAQQLRDALAKLDAAKERDARMAQGRVSDNGSMDVGASSGAGSPPVSSERSPSPSLSEQRAAEKRRDRDARQTAHTAAYNQFCDFSLGGAPLTAEHLAERGRYLQALMTRCEEPPSERGAITHFLHVLRKHRDGPTFSTQLQVKVEETPFVSFADFISYAVKTAPAQPGDAGGGGGGGGGPSNVDHTRGRGRHNKRERERGVSAVRSDGGGGGNYRQDGGRDNRQGNGAGGFDNRQGNGGGGFDNRQGNGGGGGSNRHGGGGGSGGSGRPQVNPNRVSDQDRDQRMMHGKCWYCGDSKLVKDKDGNNVWRPPHKGTDCPDKVAKRLPGLRESNNQSAQDRAAGQRPSR